MNTSRKAGPASQKPAPLSPDDERLLAFQPGEMTAETREAIAAHRARYLKARAARPVQEEPVIRPVRDPRFDETFVVSGLMPFDGDQS